MATIQTILVSNASDDATSQIESLIQNQPELSFDKTVDLENARDSIEGISSSIIWIELESDAEGGLNLLKDLIKTNPNSYFVVSKQEIDADLVKRAMQIGALDFLDHKGWNAQIRSVIRRVATKEWGAKKTSTAIRSAIPNANIKKSGAWTMPGKQAHKPMVTHPAAARLIGDRPKPTSKPEPQPIKSKSTSEKDEPAVNTKPEPQPIPEAPKFDPEPPIEEEKEPVKEIIEKTEKLPEAEPEPEPEPEEKEEEDAFPDAEPEKPAFPDEEPDDPIANLIKEAEQEKREEKPQVEAFPLASSTEIDQITPEMIEQASRNEEQKIQPFPESSSTDIDQVTPEMVEAAAKNEAQHFDLLKPEDTGAGPDIPIEEPLPSEETAELPKEKPEPVTELEAVVDEDEEEIQSFEPEEPEPEPETEPEVSIKTASKKSKWEELDSLISTQRESKSQIDSATKKQPSEDEVVSLSLDDTKEVLRTAGDGSKTKVDLLDEEDDEVVVKEAVKEEVKTSKWDTLDTISTSERKQPAEEEFDTASSGEELLKPEGGSKWGDLDAIPTPGASPDTDKKVAATDSGSKWGDLDSIPTPDKSSEAKEEAPSANKWGDLDSIPTPGEISEAKEEAPAVPAANKWGDLDSIPTPGGGLSSGSGPGPGPSPSPSSGLGSGPGPSEGLTKTGAKWGDLDSIPSPGGASDSASAPAGGGSPGGMFGDIEGLDGAKVGSESNVLKSAKWGDDVSGSSAGFGNRKSGSRIGRTTGSFSTLQSDPNTSLVEKNESQPEELPEELVEEKPKAMPVPQAQAPNKWTGSSEGGGVQVSSSLKKMDGGSGRPMLQKPDIKISMASVNWTVGSWIAASIVSIVMIVLSISFFSY